MHLPHLSLAAATDIFMLSYSQAFHVTALSRIQDLSFLLEPQLKSSSCQFHSLREHQNYDFDKARVFKKAANRNLQDNGSSDFDERN
jgi:hypothetical protein